MGPRLSSNSSARELLSRIPVPRTDPLAEESTLDRPRKARYTETDVAQGWLDLGRLPTDELQKKNRAELETLLSAMEKP